MASAFCVHPGPQYVGYIDWRVLGILLSLMLIVAGFQSNGLFDAIGSRLLAKLAEKEGLELPLHRDCGCLLYGEGPESIGAGGSGAGITIQPIAFLVISNGNVRILQIEPYVSSVDRVVASVPDVVDKIAGLFNKDKKDKEDEDISLPPQY